MYFPFAFLFLFFETLIRGWILRQKNNKIDFITWQFIFSRNLSDLNPYLSNIQFLNNWK